MRHIRLLILALALVFVAVFPEVVTACPLCSEETQAQSNLTDDSPDLAAGFSYSVLFMLAVPYSMLAGFGYMLYRNHQRVVAADQGITQETRD